MAWETRKRGGRYYTRSHRQGGQVVREYIGAGEIGAAIAQLDTLEREKRQMAVAAWRKERVRLQARDTAIADYCRDVDELVRAALIAAGYRQHNRGEWRRKRMPAKAAVKTTERSLEQIARDGDQAQLQRAMGNLMNRAQHGDSKAMTKLRDAWNTVGEREWEKTFTGPTDAARDKLLEVLGDNLLLREAWARRTRGLQRDLEGTNPTPLERTLCERIATCWLDTQLTDMQYASKSVAGMSVQAGDYWRRSQERAQRRYLDATIALARVRRLLAPIMQQVNIATPGSQQVNIAAASGSPATPANGETIPAAVTSAGAGEEHAPV
ncbi:MAG TPA: hypothetical protein VGF38_24195 [Ktedonobacterales bacterium]|jgi:hypothetical protein